MTGGLLPIGAVACVVLFGAGALARSWRVWLAGYAAGAIALLAALIEVTR